MNEQYTIELRIDAAGRALENYLYWQAIGQNDPVASKRAYEECRSYAVEFITAMGPLFKRASELVLIEAERATEVGNE